LGSGRPLQRIDEAKIEQDSRCLDLRSRKKAKRTSYTTNECYNLAATIKTIRETSLSTSVGTRLNLSTTSVLGKPSVSCFLTCPAKQVPKANWVVSLSSPFAAHLSRQSSHTDLIVPLASIPPTFSNQAISGPLTATCRSCVQVFVKEMRLRLQWAERILTVGGTRIVVLLESLLIWKSKGLSRWRRGDQSRRSSSTLGPTEMKIFPIEMVL